MKKLEIENMIEDGRLKITEWEKLRVKHGRSIYELLKNFGIQDRDIAGIARILEEIAEIDIPKPPPQPPKRGFFNRLFG